MRLDRLPTSETGEGQTSEALADLPIWTASLAALALTSLQASAAPPITCSEMVDRLMAEIGGKLLSVAPLNDQCRLTVLIREPGKRPRREVITVTPGEMNGAALSDRDGALPGFHEP